MVLVLLALHRSMNWITVARPKDTKRWKPSQRQKKKEKRIKHKTRDGPPQIYNRNTPGNQSSSSELTSSTMLLLLLLRTLPSRRGSTTTMPTSECVGEPLPSPQSAWLLGTGEHVSLHGQGNAGGQRWVTRTEPSSSSWTSPAPARRRRPACSSPTSASPWSPPAPWR